MCLIWYFIVENFTISSITSLFSINQTLTISVMFGFLRDCDPWNVSVELQISNLSQNVIVLPCSNNDETSKNCTASILVEQLDFICSSNQAIKIRPVYSRFDLTRNVYRGSWTEQLIKSTKPPEWNEDEHETEPTVESDYHTQKITVEWKSSLCYGGLVKFPTNLSIVSDQGFEKYNATIPFNCSRLSENGVKISLKRKILIDNGQITCSDRSRLHKKEKFKLMPCTLYFITLTPLAVQNREGLRTSSVTNNFTTAFYPIGIKRNCSFTIIYLLWLTLFINSRSSQYVW